MPRTAPPLAGGGESDVGWSRGLRQTPAPLCHSLPPATARIPYAVGLPFLSSSHCQNSLRHGPPLPNSSSHCQNTLRPGPPLPFFQPLPEFLTPWASPSFLPATARIPYALGLPFLSSSHCQNSLRPGPPLPFFQPLPEFLTPWASPSFLPATARIPYALGLTTLSANGQFYHAAQIAESV